MTYLAGVTRFDDLVEDLGISRKVLAARLSRLVEEDVLVATSHERDLDHALAEVRRDLIRQIEDERARREPRKGRKSRYRTT